MYLTQRRLRLRYVEQDERQDDHVVRGLRKGQLRRVCDDPGVAGRCAAKHVRELEGSVTGVVSSMIDSFIDDDEIDLSRSFRCRSRPWCS